MNKKYYMPTKVFSGSECIKNNKDEFKCLGKKAMIVTGTKSAKMNGSEIDVKEALDSVGINYIVFDKIKSNPTIKSTYEGAYIAKENGVDFIIAIGGGSPIDAGKAIALLAVQDIKEDKLFTGNYKDKVLPIAAIPTTAGTGSEVTQYSILTNDKAQTKTSIATELIFPRIAFLDSKYMNQLSVDITINTGIDALSHAIEGMLSVKSSVISNALAKESIRMILACVPKMLEALATKSINVIDSEQREKLLVASYLAGMVIAQTGTTAVHAMGYSLTYFRNIDHGRANGLLLGEYLRFIEKKRSDLVQEIIEAMNVRSVEEYIEIMNQLFGEKEKLSPEEILKYSEMAISTKNINNCIVKPKEYDLIEMYSVSFSS